MKQIIEDLYKLDRYLLGEGYDKALAYINEIIPLEVLEFPSGTKLETWEVPQEWVIRDAWVKFNGEKIIDWQKDKLAVSQGSVPVNKKITLEELRKHLNVSEDRKGATPYNYHFYDNEWSFNMPYDKLQKVKANEKGEICDENGICYPDLKGIDPEVGKVQVEGWKPEYEVLLKEGEYEVFIDSEYKPGVMKVGVHTIPGNNITGTVLDKEILLFAHLDHPWQANDNLSSVAGLIDMASSLKEKGFNHTIKLIFCPETIGSIAYALTQNISKVDFVIGLDCIGNDHDLLWQKSFDAEDKINRVTHLAVTNLGKTHRKAQFRKLIGSDEYVFNDPSIQIPGIMLSRWDEPDKGYSQYHTSDDSPDIISEEKIREIQEIILKIIDIYEKDYIPERNFKAPLFRSKYGMHFGFKDLNLQYDYLIFLLDGKKSLAELVCELGINFDFTYDLFQKMVKDGIIKNPKDSRPHRVQKGKRKAKK